MANNFFSFSPKIQRNCTPHDEEKIFKELSPEPLEHEPQPSAPKPTESTTVNRNIIRPKSVGELTEMVATLSARKSMNRRPSAGPSRVPQGEVGHLKQSANETTVAFGRTTKLKDTIQGPKPVSHGTTRPLVGTAKEVENLKKTIELQQSQLANHETEITSLKAACTNQHNEYVELLNTCDVLMLRMSTLEKNVAALPTSFNSDVPVIKNALANDVSSTSTACKPRNVIIDSVTLVKGHNLIESRSKRREIEYVGENEDPIKENAKTPPPQTVAAIQRINEVRARRQKRKDDMNRTLEQRPIEKLNQNTKNYRYDNRENRYYSQNDDYDLNPDSQPVSGRYKEKVTYQREYLYSPGRNADGPYLSTTIESTLRRGPNVGYEPLENRNHRHQNQRQLQIEEPSEFEDEPDYDDDFRRRSGHNVSAVFVSPLEPQQRCHNDVQYTVMPDVYEDESESEKELPPKAQHRGRQKVADRLVRNRRS